MHRKLFFLILAMLAAPAVAVAQDSDIVVSDTLIEVRVADGSILFGKIVSVTATQVTIRTSGGTDVTLHRNQIRSVRKVRGSTRPGGDVWPEDPNMTRLFVLPTGRALPAGRAQFGVLELFFPFVSYGITDRITVTAGTPVIPGNIGEVFYLAPKVEVISTPNAHVSASVLGFLGGSDGDFGSAGVLYGVGTFGSTDRSVTVGVGFPFYAGEGENELADRPLLIVGGESRVSRRVKLLAESAWFSYSETVYEYPSDTYVERTEWAGLLGAGLRFIGDRISADAGLGLIVGDGAGCCLPLVNFAYTFGRR